MEGGQWSAENRISKDSVIGIEQLSKEEIVHKNNTEQLTKRIIA